MTPALLAHQQRQHSAAPFSAAEHEALRSLLRVAMLGFQKGKDAQVQTIAPPAAPKPWLLIADAAEYSGLSVRLIRRLAKAKLIASVKDGRLKVKAADLDSFDVSNVPPAPPKKRKAEAAS